MSEESRRGRAQRSFQSPQRVAISPTTRPLSSLGQFSTTCSEISFVKTSRRCPCLSAPQDLKAVHPHLLDCPVENSALYIPTLGSGSGSWTSRESSAPNNEDYRKKPPEQGFQQNFDGSQRESADITAHRPRKVIDVSWAFTTVSCCLRTSNVDVLLVRLGLVAYGAPRPTPSSFAT